MNSYKIGERVLVEAVYYSEHVPERSVITIHNAHACYPNGDGMAMSVPDTSIHPLPGAGQCNQEIRMAAQRLKSWHELCIANFPIGSTHRYIGSLGTLERDDAMMVCDAVLNPLSSAR